MDENTVEYTSKAGTLSVASCNRQDDIQRRGCVAGNGIVNHLQPPVEVYNSCIEAIYSDCRAGSILYVSHNLVFKRMGMRTKEHTSKVGTLSERLAWRAVIDKMTSIGAAALQEIALSTICSFP
jgi:hypothetical protein